MSHRKSFNTPGHAHFLTFSCWQRKPFFNDRQASLEFVRSLDQARMLAHFDVWAYVIMPEHVHLLIWPLLDNYSIAAILRRIKESPARNILARWRKHSPLQLEEAADLTHGPISYRFWQPGGGYDRNLYRPETIRRAIEYIEWNPIRRGLVTDPVNWTWSSARCHAGCSGVPLVVDPVDWDKRIRIGETDLTH